MVGVRPRAPTLFMADEDVRHAQNLILIEVDQDLLQTLAACVLDCYGVS